MSNVEFSEDVAQQFTSREVLGEMKVPKMAKLLSDAGIVKTPTQAGYVLLGTVIVCLLLSGIIGYKTLFTDEIITVPPVIGGTPPRR